MLNIWRLQLFPLEEKQILNFFFYLYSFGHNGENFIERDLFRVLVEE